MDYTWGDIARYESDAFWGIDSGSEIVNPCENCDGTGELPSGNYCRMCDGTGDADYEVEPVQDDPYYDVYGYPGEE